MKLQGNILGLLTFDKPVQPQIRKPVIIPIKEEKKSSITIASNKKQKELTATKSFEKPISQTVKKDRTNGIKKMQISI